MESPDQLWAHQPQSRNGFGGLGLCDWQTRTCHWKRLGPTTSEARSFCGRLDVGAPRSLLASAAHRPGRERYISKGLEGGQSSCTMWS